MSSSFINSSHFIAVANGVFLDKNLQLNPYYEKLTKELYAGEIARKPLLSYPVQSAFEINRWVQHATRNKIREIVSPEQVSNAPMVLVSALYFKAKWETMFIEPDTRLRPYYLNGRDSPPIDIYTMATSGCFPFYEEKKLGVKIVGLPYQEGKSTMYIIMPNQSDRKKIRDLQDKLTVGQVNQLIDRMVVKTGTILLPKMKLENTLGLKDVLVSQGLQQIFSPYLSNLTEITKNGQIIGDVNRQDQPSSTLKPRTTKRKPPSSKPKPTTQSTNIQDIYNVPSPVPGYPAWPTPRPATQPMHTPDMNQYGPSTFPGNPASSKPSAPTQSTHSPDVSSNSQPIGVGLTENDCNLTNNCFYNGYTCNCYPKQPIQRDDRGCYPKPWTFQQNCPPKRQVYTNYPMCLADSQDYQVSGGQCAQNCKQLRDWCYCCKPYVPQPTQQAIIPQSSVDYQQNSNAPNPFDIGTRLGSNDVSTPPPVVCVNYEKCNYFGLICRTYQHCALVNTDGIPVPSKSGRRNKRQTQNNSSPPNLYVGDVLHKITLDINEQGTEGGAVTAVVIDRISSSFNLRVDGPFLIYLRNDVTKLPLFYGAVFDPSP